MLNSKLEFQKIKMYPAEEEHVEYILNILNPYMSAGKLLPRNENDILKHLRSFFIASYKNNYVGCVAVRDYKNGLFEIRSLAVSADISGKGVGSALITFAIEVVKNDRKGQKVFALTRRPNVFTRLGFKIVPMEMFPKKIWFDCSKCKKLDNCDEVAVLYTL
jgi:amino-acid N-acetyltransferase